MNISVAALVHLKLQCRRNKLYLLFLPKFDTLDLFDCCTSTQVFLIEALGLVDDEDLLPSFRFEVDFAFLFLSRLRFIKV